MDRGELEASAAELQKLVEASPYYTKAWFILGTLRQQLGDSAAAIAAFRKVRELDPADGFGALLHLAKLGAEPECAMPQAYVRGLFDHYAARFDAELTDTLSYRGPALLRAAVEKICTAEKRPMRFSEMLDLGCGTGLAGAEFRPSVGRLTGVDLSPAMVDVARAKNLYDRLEAGDIIEFLDAASLQAASYGLAVAADVFAYFADLAPVLTAAARVLAQHGILAFTVERHDGDGYVLNDKLRYAHSGEHVRRAVAAAGLTLVDLAEASTRTEAGVAVPGLIAVAVRRKDRA